MGNPCLGQEGQRYRTAQRPDGAQPECYTGAGSPGSEEEGNIKGSKHDDVRIFLGGERASVVGRGGGRFHRYQEGRKAFMG